MRETRPFLLLRPFAELPRQVDKRLPSLRNGQELAESWQEVSFSLWEKFSFRKPAPLIQGTPSILAGR